MRRPLADFYTGRQIGKIQAKREKISNQKISEGGDRLLRRASGAGFPARLCGIATVQDGPGAATDRTLFLRLDGAAGAGAGLAGEFEIRLATR